VSCKTKKEAYAVKRTVASSAEIERRSISCLLWGLARTRGVVARRRARVNLEPGAPNRRTNRLVSCR
jgi:hypothetical protein